MSDKCPSCDSPTTVAIDSKSLARKVTCESCGYENIENIESTVSINANPPQDKSPNKKPAIVDHTKSFVFIGYLVLIGTIVAFLPPAWKGWLHF